MRLTRFEPYQARFVVFWGCMRIKLNIQSSINPRHLRNLRIISIPINPRAFIHGVRSTSGGLGTLGQRADLRSAAKRQARVPRVSLICSMNVGFACWIHARGFIGIRITPRLEHSQSNRSVTPISPKRKLGDQPWVSAHG